jgi:hypothetical protein
VSERIQQLKAQLERTRAVLNAVFDQVGERWQTQVYSEGAQWTAHQLAIHISLASSGMALQAIKISQGEKGVSEDFDLEKYNRSSVEKRKDKTIEEIRHTLTNDRAKLVEWLDSVQDDNILNNIGRHASGNMLSVEQFIQVIADHEETHARDIAKVLAIQV